MCLLRVVSYHRALPQTRKESFLIRKTPHVSHLISCDVCGRKLPGLDSMQIIPLPFYCILGNDFPRISVKQTLFSSILSQETRRRWDYVSAQALVPVSLSRHRNVLHIAGEVEFGIVTLYRFICIEMRASARRFAWCYSRAVRSRFRDTKGHILSTPPFSILIPAHQKTHF